MPAPQLPLTYLYRTPAVGTAEPWLLVVMHGLGKNEQDLFALAQQVHGRYHVLSLRAPFRMEPGGYAWFEFSEAPDGERTIDEAQELHSRALVTQAVQAAAAQLGVPSGRVVVGGLSQGGMMSLTLLLTQPALLQAAMVWHGQILPHVLPAAAPAAALQGKQLWVSHGRQDNVIALAEAHDTRDHFAQLPVDLCYREFEGMHEVPPDELAATVDWLGGL